MRIRSIRSNDNYWLSVAAYLLIRPYNSINSIKTHLYLTLLTTCWNKPSDKSDFCCQLPASLFPSSRTLSLFSLEMFYCLLHPCRILDFIHIDSHIRVHEVCLHKPGRWGSNIKMNIIFYGKFIKLH